MSEVILGDCLEVLDGLEKNSIDTIITDPPYELDFMGKGWDRSGIAFNVKLWEKALRVSKPGATLLAFGGTRTYHRLACAIEDGGWEIRDCIMWLYGSGFPKSHNIAKAIDKHLGVEPTVVSKQRQSGAKFKVTQMLIDNGGFNDPDREEYEITVPTSDEAKEWDGWGTALKPSWEPILVAQKPYEQTYAHNALEYGVAGLNIDGARVGISGGPSAYNFGDEKGIMYGEGRGKPTNDILTENKGRWPANVILECICDEVLETDEERISGRTIRSDQNNTYNKSNVGDNPGEKVTQKQIIHTNPNCPGYMLDKQSGTSISSGGKNPGQQPAFLFPEKENRQYFHYGDKGGASRFFYCAKASRTERELGLDDLELKHKAGAEFRPNHMEKAQEGETGNPYGRWDKIKNIHPTVKPISLMEYLCKLTATPTGGVVLDMFCGSGTTGIGCIKTNREYILIDNEPDYIEISKARLEYWKKQHEFENMQGRMF